MRSEDAIEPAGVAPEHDVRDRLRNAIRDIPDFPKEGILFRDITTLLLDPEAHSLAVKALAEPFRNDLPDQIMGIESRGFIFGSTLALELGVGFILARKPGKLPGPTLSVSYDLEYGSDSLEVHKDAIQPGSKVLVVDDLLATGGTAKGACELVEILGGHVAGAVFLIELTGLNGRELLGDRSVYSILPY
ncbi:MAG: adenine phosphoribosyltransferase [Acidobacteriota bacterium]|jgi:adenine phosphoribosyltransferase|nr:adenine phosphoribosyltransferase [Acidobacteriota bacterium]